MLVKLRLVYLLYISGILITVLKSTNSAITKSSVSKTISPKYTVCQTKECMKLAAEYERAIDFSYNPCDDFLKFVCGKTNSDSAIPRDRIHNLESRKGADQVLRILGELFEKPKILKPKNVIETAQAFYQGCMEMDTLPLQTVVNEVHKMLKEFGGMPFIPATQYDETMTWQKRTTNLYRHLGNGIFFKISVQPFTENTTINMILIEPIEEDFKQGGTSGMYSNTTAEAYKNFMKHSLCVMSNENCNTNVEVEKVVEEIAQFEINLVNLTKQPTKLSNGGQYQFNPKHIKENLQTYSDEEFEYGMYFMEVAEAIGINLDVDEYSPFALINLEYLGNVVTLLNTTEKRIVDNYIGWRLFQMLPAVFTPTLRKHIKDMNVAVIGYEELPPLSKACARYTKEHFPLTSSRIYIERFLPRSLKKDVEAYTLPLKNHVKKMIKRSKWMDEETQRVALLKIDNIQQNIAYPEWIFDDRLLEIKEGLPEPFEGETYITSVINCYRQRMNKVRRDFRTPFDRDRWLKPPVDTLAYMHVNLHKMVLGAGILQPPFYYHNTLSSINYGALATIISHEMTHILYEPTKFDEQGNRKDWWTNNTHDAFKNIYDCFVNMYNFTDEETNITMDGPKYIYEVIADSGGLQASYEAYLSTNPVDERLPGLENLTPLQLFFIAEGRNFCGVYRKQYRKHQIEIDRVHPPDHYRVYLDSKNFKGFSDAFQCPVGSAMNTGVRCDFF